MENTIEIWFHEIFSVKEKSRCMHTEMQLWTPISPQFYITELRYEKKKEITIFFPFYDFFSTFQFFLGCKCNFAIKYGQKVSKNGRIMGKCRVFDKWIPISPIESWR